MLPDVKHVNCWFNIIRFKSIKNLNKDFELFMNNKKIETRAVWKPLHTQKFLKKYEKFKVTNTMKIINNCYCIPSSPIMKKKDILKVYKAVKEFSEKYIR